MDVASELRAARRRAGLAVVDVPGRRSAEELERAGHRLAAVLDLSEHLPFRRPGELRFPRLPSG